jgi:hypothetical protein
MPRTTLHATLGLVVSLACATLLSGQQASATSPTTLRHEIELADSIMVTNSVATSRPISSSSTTRADD